MRATRQQRFIVFTIILDYSASLIVSERYGGIARLDDSVRHELRQAQNKKAGRTRLFFA
jgi:hypothetical protein